MDPWRATQGGVLLDVWLVPRSRSPGVAGVHGRRIKVRVTAPPEAGRANREAEELLSEILGADVTLVRGMKQRKKVFMASGTDVATVRKNLAS